MNKKRIDLTGKKFGKWNVIKFAYISDKHVYYWKCICGCGKKKSVNGWLLRSGKSKSCGCSGSRYKKGYLTTHGMTNTKIFKRWQTMLSRCSNPKFPGYHNYGGRGIAVSKRWLKFENFYKDMGDPPKGYWIERVNNNKGYSKGNCKWATPSEQALNKRKKLELIKQI